MNISTKTLSKWTDPNRVAAVMRAAPGCTADDAREYLIAEEGNEEEAVLSYLTDRVGQGAMR
jgi:hypothetical protein